MPRCHIIINLLILSLIGCGNIPDFPQNALESDYVGANSLFVKEFGLIGIYGQRILVNSEMVQGSDLIFHINEKYYVMTYLNKTKNLSALSKATVFSKHPVKTVINKSPAFKGVYKGKEKVILIINGKHVLYQPQ